MSDRTLAQVASELELTARELGEEGVATARATALLEELARLAEEAAAVLEARVEELAGEEPRRAPPA